jgi:hypothetical protein
MFIPTRVIFCETTCDQMMKNDFSCANFFWLRQSIQGKEFPDYHGFSYPIVPLLDLEYHWPHLRNSLNLLGAVCTSKPKQQTLSAFHTSNEHNSPHKKTGNTIGQLKNFNKREQLIYTLTRTFYEASASTEEDRRRRCGRGDSAEDGAEPHGFSIYIYTHCLSTAD